ncbi:hypothetical protein Z052_15440 [Halorubrum sp. C191]|uniref:restriction endonuclease n=1 Tax=Halorubrum sp. C191 TaxID=1383842 RepID=UPI000C083CAF|nr:restriction endonuclease [Halorubrum sp. C191]PHQ41266.1 hypothetical protein Z052_15440 [Halorubrum sp. C191]
MPREKTDLPVGDAFAPAQLSKKLDDADFSDYDVEHTDEELPVLLELAREFEGDSDAFDEAIENLFYSDPDRAFTVRTGMAQNGYEIMDENFEFTDLGEELYEMRDDYDELYDRFAQHILLNLDGLKGIEIIEDLEAQGKRTINDNLKQEFRKQYDYHIDETSNHWSQMRAWMSKADIINTNTQHYKIDRTKIEELTGLDEDVALDLDELDANERAFLRALALVNPDGQIDNSVVKRLAEEAYGVDISQSKIGTNLLDPLEEKGFIEWEHRNGKPNLVEQGDRFEAEILIPVLENLAERSDVPRRVLRKSYGELLDEMDSSNTYEKGMALETLSVKLGRMLGLEFVGWRVRGRETGGSEVDVVMDDLGLTYSRVQIQCKNIKGKLQTKHIAREVGISRTLQTNTILMIARGGVTTDAKRFANRIMHQENLAIMFLTGEDIEEIDDNPDRLRNVLRGETRRIHNRKQLGERDMVDEDEDDDAPDEVDEGAVLDDFKDEIDDATVESEVEQSDFRDLFDEED